MRAKPMFMILTIPNLLLKKKKIIHIGIDGISNVKMAAILIFNFCISCCTNVFQLSISDQMVSLEGRNERKFDIFTLKMCILSLSATFGMNECVQHITLVGIVDC